LKNASVSTLLFAEYLSEICVTSEEDVYELEFDLSNSIISISEGLFKRQR
jgi:hypothetical protein